MVVLATVIVADLAPDASGVKVTWNVAVPPKPGIVVDESPLTTNCGSSDITVIPSAAEPIFVIVYVTGAAADGTHVFPWSNVPVTASTGPVISTGTSSPVPSSIEVPGKPVKLILASLLSLRPVGLLKKILPLVPLVEYAPVQPSIVRTSPAQVIPSLGANIME